MASIAGELGGSIAGVELAYGYRVAQTKQIPAAANSNKGAAKRALLRCGFLNRGHTMPPVNGLPASQQPSVLNPQIDLGEIPPLDPKSTRASTTRLASSRTPQASKSRTETATPAGEKVWVARKTTTEKMPSAYIVPPAPFPAVRIGVDDLDIKTQLELNKNTNWSSLRGGELQIRYDPEMSKLGKGKIYQVRGANSTVNIAASTWVQAAKEGVRLSENGALAPQTQNIAKSKPAGAKKDTTNPAMRPPNEPTSQKITKPFVPSENEPIPKADRINPYDRTYTPR